MQFTAYPMVREARERVALGELGQLRLVQVEHAGSFGGTQSSRMATAVSLGELIQRRPDCRLCWPMSEPMLTTWLGLSRGIK